MADENNENVVNADFWNMISGYINSVRVVRPRLFRDRSDPLTIYNDVEFRMRYRLSKQCFMELVNDIGDQLLHNNNRHTPTRLLIEISGQTEPRLFPCLR